MQPDDGGVVSGVEHHQGAIGALLGCRVEELGDVAELDRKVRVPVRQQGVELPVAALPLFDVAQCAYVNGLLQELVDLGQDPQDLDVVGKGTKILRLAH